MKAKPYLGPFLIILSIFIAIVSRQGYNIYNFKKNGSVAQATIQKKYINESSKAWGIRSIKQPPRYSFIKKTDYYFDVGISQGNEQSKSDFKFIKSSFQISSGALAQLKKGGSLLVIYLPDNPETSALSHSDFKNNFYTLNSDTLSLYQQKGKTANAIVQDINKSNGMINVMFTSYVISSSGKYISAKIPVDKSIYDTYKPGEKIEVVYLQDNPEDSMIAKKMLDSLIYVNPYLGIFLTILSLAIGLYLTVNVRTSSKD